MRITTLILRAAVISAAALAPLSGFAAQPPEHPSASAGTIMAAAVSDGSGMANDSLLERLLSRRSEDLLLTHSPNGTVLLDLADHQAMVMLIRRNDDGSVSYACVDSLVRARQFLAPNHPTTADQIAPEK